MIKSIKSSLRHKSDFQFMSSIFVSMIGLFVVLITANTFMTTMTGNAIGSTDTTTSISTIVVMIWGFLIIIAGIWMWRIDDFHKSIFD